ncbi:MAG: metallophosphoesterase [Planctomycetota bacterium]|jgi:Icc-related predicted phosphoesterase|nr:metallophosphoesterase [Planctomycetota bacterium]MDP7254080.1 metallophosphoesterase [Planctomycetota bacterium]
MQILLLTDTHGTFISHETTEWRLEEYPIDLILIAGDFSYFDQQYERLMELVKSSGVPFFFTSGNHESVEFCKNVELLYGGVYLDGAYIRYRELCLAGLCGHDIFYPNRANNIVDFQNLQIDMRGTRFSILLSHEPPRPWLFQGRDCGSLLVRETIEHHGFDLVVTGHLHTKTPRIETMEQGTKVINPGTRGAVIELDTTSGEFEILSPMMD